MTLSELEAGCVLPVDKPYGWTSFQVVNKIKWQLKRELGIKKFKIGHSGTLDPLATGLLLVCVGKATKRIEELQNDTKVYSGTIVIGATTPCYDLEQAIDCYYPTKHLTPELIQQAKMGLTGEIDQVPPMFSAIKVEGERAYTYARDNEIVTIAPKKITIHSFEITATRNLDNILDLSHSNPPNESTTTDSPHLEKELYRHPQGHVPEGLPQIDFRIRCSKGTYIRSIARDLGIALGSGAFLSALRREQIGNYSVEEALKVESNVPMAL